MLMERTDIMVGAKIGRWTVLNSYLKTARGEKKWLCRCECGTERYVLERSLRHGGSLSCGCLRKEEAEKSVSYDLTGEKFGQLTVIKKADNQRENGGVWWTCLCECGEQCDVSASLLVTGRKTHCGGKAHPKNYASSDITGQRFHRLVAMYPQKERDAKGFVIWRCKCDCGNEVDVSLNSLLYGNMRSCGCQKKEHNQKLKTTLTHVAGTSIDMLRSKKVPTDNTTGYRGVYFIRGKYVAKIVFRKKAYYLGTFDSIEEAAEARKEAEKVVFDSVAQHYAQWNEKAKKNPSWGRANPIQIFIHQDDSTKRMHAVLLPEFDEKDSNSKAAN